VKQPLNQVVFEDLLNKIKSGYYPPGEKLPTESELQSIYGVSRAPIRQALGKLQTGGVIDRRPGIGTVVIENNLSGPWPLKGGFGSNFSKKWNQLRTRTIEISKVIPDQEVSELLRLESETPVVKVTRIRLEDEVPIFYNNHFYINADMDKIRDAGEILNMRQFAVEHLGINFSYVTEEIVASAADETISYYLGVEKGHPLLQIKRVSFDSEYKPVEYVRYYVRSEDWSYKVSYHYDGEDNHL
jgi:GntR family transcriptional regulator